MKKMTAREVLIEAILKHWKVPKIFSPEEVRQKAQAKYPDEADGWKVEFQIEKRRRQHTKVLQSAEYIATLAEEAYSVK